MRTLFLCALLLPAQEPQTTIRATAQEVLLDVIVRDKKGRTLRDITAGEVEVFDAGTPVRIRAFRRVEGAELPSPGSVLPSAPRPARALDPLRQVRLVTLVFERLGPGGRRLFREAALDLLGSASEPNLYFSIFYIDQRLHLLQQFSNDRHSLRAAIDRAVSGAYSQFDVRSGELRQQLEETARRQQAADAAAESAALTGAPGVPDTVTSAALAQMQLQMMQFTETMVATQQTRSSLFALLGLVREQARLPGRKMVVYFSEGFGVPGSLQEPFHALISAANRANVSVYAVDARGLLTGSQNEAGRTLLDSAARSSRNEQERYRPGRSLAVTPDQVQVFDTVMEGLRANPQESLAELATGTGGVLISDSNDLRAPLRRAVEDVLAYYEIAYTPSITNYDGHFRKIEVRVRRPDVVVQTRSGYFALPPLNDAPLFPFEIPLLRALAASPLPDAFPYRAGVQRFHPDGEYGVTIDLPLDRLTFAVDPEKRLHRVRASLLIFFKNQQGAIVAKMSRDFPFEAPLDKLEAFRAGHLIQTYHLKLAPGRYTLETAVADRNAEAVSSRRSVLVVPPPASRLALSNLVLIRRLEPAPEETDPADPYHFSGGKVVPSLADTLIRARELPLYFVVFPESGNPAPPELTVALLENDKLVARSSPALPKPDPDGRIPYIATLPVATLPHGSYEVRAIVRQGTATAAERVFVNLE